MPPQIVIFILKSSHFSQAKVRLACFVWHLSDAG
jgi:hypothetical protein